MAITEHMEMIAAYKREIMQEIKPLLDDQQLEEIYYKVVSNYEGQISSKISYWCEGEFHEIEGLIDKINFNDRSIRIFHDDSVSRIRFEDILGIEDAD